MISTVRKRWASLSCSQKRFVKLHMVIELVRCLYSFLFYNEVDLPCYAQFTRRFLSGDFHYDRYFCQWGYCYYPVFFLELYAILHIITFGFNSVLIRLVHLLAQLLTHFLMDITFVRHVKRGKWVSVAISCLAQSYYFATISRLTNDTFSTLLVQLCLLCLLEKNMWFASLFYTLSVAFKMNTLFIGPALLLLYFFQFDWQFWPVFWQFAFMGVVQLILPLPFLLTDWKAYLSISFNMSRDFEPRNNLAWGWLGDVLRLSPAFYSILLLLTVVCLFGFLFRQLHRCWCFRSKNSLAKERLIITTFIVPAFIGVCFSRGVHVQFLVWILWSLPFLLTCVCGLSTPFAIFLMFLFDHCFTWNDGFFDLTSIPKIFIGALSGDWLLFRDGLYWLSRNRWPVYSDTVLEHLNEGMTHAEKYLGRWYPAGTMADVSIIQHSVVLAMIELFVLVRIFTEKRPKECISLTESFKHQKIQ